MTFYDLEYHSMTFWIAITMLNTIALIAMLVARSELRKALREIDKLSSSRASRSAASRAATTPDANK